jgi:hypothetical protein
MKGFQSAQNFQEVKSCFRFSHSLNSLKQVKKLSTTAVLQRNAYFLLCFYRVMYLCDEWMAELSEDFLFVLNDDTFSVF